MEQNYVSNVVKNYNPNLNLDHNINITDNRIKL